MSKRSGTRAVLSAILGVGVISVGLISARAAEPLPAAQATENEAHATGLGVRDALTVSESTAAPNHAEWSAVSVGGTSLIGRDQDGWSGAGAGAGASVDALNGALCPERLALTATQQLGLCVAVLPSAASVSGPGENRGQWVAASGALLDAHLGVYAPGQSGYAGGLNVLVLPSHAMTTEYACGSPWTSSADLLVVGGIPGLGLGESASHRACSAGH
jgi:hypothetical protein